MGVVYTWANDNYSVPAEVVAERVQAIAQEHGVCHPAALVDDARPEDSPMHPLFEWDDAKAAESYRIDQARRVIRSIRIVLEEDGREPVAPAFVHVDIIQPSGRRTPGYMPSIRAVSDTEYRAQVINDVLSQIRGLRSRHAALSELQPIWDAVDQLTISLDSLAIAAAE